MSWGPKRPQEIFLWLSRWVFMKVEFISAILDIAVSAGLI